MYTVYSITFTKTDKIYFGVTKNRLSIRLAQHKRAAMSGLVTPLYCAARKYGMIIIPLFEVDTKEEAFSKEMELIAKYRDTDILLNLADGGEGGFVVPESSKSEWIEKLKKARKGRKPALGMRHTEENKKVFSEVSRNYWATNRKYTEEDIKGLGFSEARKSLGISKTHYYRLRRRLLSSDQE